MYRYEHYSDNITILRLLRHSRIASIANRGDFKTEAYTPNVLPKIKTLRIYRQAYHTTIS